MFTNLEVDNMMKTIKISKRAFLLVLAIVLIAGIFPVSKAHAASEYTGAWAMSAASQPVYSDASSGTKIGTIYKSEGITVLWYSGNVAFIEYSTSSGTKQGYLYNPNIIYYVDDNSVAEVTTTTAVYYGESTSEYKKVGTVYAGEHVIAFGKQNGWVYIEYNTSSGRKRGYVQESNLNIYYWARLGNYQTKTYGLSERTVASNKTVYAGPSSVYNVVGSVSAGETVYYGTITEDANGNPYHYIEYYVTGTSMKKSGYIL